MPTTRPKAIGRESPKAVVPHGLASGSDGWRPDHLRLCAHGLSRADKGHSRKGDTAAKSNPPRQPGYSIPRGRRVRARARATALKVRPNAPRRRED